MGFMPEQFFNKDELGKVDQVVVRAEELVNNHFKMSSGQWLKNRYDIKTAKDLASHERVTGPLAQVVKYEGRQTGVPLGSSSFILYTICLQDPAILDIIRTRPHLLLDPLLLYILTHELVHVVRFSRYEHRYENVGEDHATVAEELRVHQLTHDVLFRVSMLGMPDVFEFYGEWHKKLV